MHFCQNLYKKIIIILLEYYNKKYLRIVSEYALKYYQITFPQDTRIHNTWWWILYIWKLSSSRGSRHALFHFHRIVCIFFFLSESLLYLKRQQEQKMRWNHRNKMENGVRKKTANKATERKKSKAPTLTAKYFPDIWY